MNFEKNIGRFVGRLNYQLAQEGSRVLQREGADITTDQFRLLTHLWKKDGQPQAVLAQKTGRDKGSTARMVDTLERKEIIYRKPDLSDRRINVICLTEKGKQLESLAKKCATEVLNKATKGFSEKEIVDLQELLMKALKNFEKE